MSKENITMSAEYIINNLTTEQEEVLKDIHGENYMGTDDDMPEAYDNWLVEQTLMDLDKYLEL